MKKNTNPSPDEAKQQRSHRKRQIATWIISVIMFSVFSLDIIATAFCNHYEKEFSVTTEAFDYANGDDRIHFLNTGNSDCILLESNGMFAIIDSGEGDNNPRRKTAYKGFQKDVLNYIKKVAADGDGKVKLDFILATHYHYDHVGNFEAIIRDPDINIASAYMKEYNTKVATDLEQNGWGNKAVYDSIISALHDTKTLIVTKLPDKEFPFGDFTIKLINTVTPESLHGKGENSSSVGVKITKGSESAFLAADMTKKSGLEKLYADEIGEVTLLKIGHHGYFGSSSMAFLKVLKPKIAICTNYLGKMYPNVRWNLTMFAHVPIYATPERNGIIANFTDDGEIVLTDGIM